LGNAGDKAYLVGGWTADGGNPVGGYNVYTNGSATLRVAQAVTIVFGIDDRQGDNDSENPLVGVGATNPSAGFDIINGFGGNDTINGLGGGDILHGGSGNDVLSYYSSDVMVDGGSGTDSLKLSGSLDLAGVAGTKITDIARKERQSINQILLHY
jgi:Ca2+-binding RTX toxin-like protein